MSETVKLVIEIPADVYRTVHKHKSCVLTTKQDDQEILIGVRKGILLDDVKAEIEQICQDIDTCSHNEYENAVEQGKEIAYENVLSILDNIGKAESEGENADNN